MYYESQAGVITLKNGGIWYDWYQNRRLWGEDNGMTWFALGHLHDQAPVRDFAEPRTDRRSRAVPYP